MNWTKNGKPKQFGMTGFKYITKHLTSKQTIRFSIISI